MDVPHYRGNLLIRRLGGGDQPVHVPSLGGRQARQGKDQGQGHFVFLEVVTGGLAGDLLDLGKVEQVVDDLEGHAEMVAETGHGEPFRRGRPKRPHLARA